MCGTVGTSRAAGSARGSPVNSPSTFVSSTSSGAWSRLATIAARWSLSPNLISATETVSFSLMTGRQPYSNRVRIVLPGVQVADPAVEVAGGEQDLGGVDAVRGQALLVRLHEGRLADGGAGLQVRQVGRPPAQPEPADPRPDRPGANQGHPPAAGPESGELVGQGLDAAAVQGPGRVGQHVGADLDHDRVGPADDVGAVGSAMASRGLGLTGMKRRRPAGDKAGPETAAGPAGTCAAGPAALLSVAVRRVSWRLPSTPAGGRSGPPCSHRVEVHRPRWT